MVAGAANDASEARAADGSDGEVRGINKGGILAA